MNDLKERIVTIAEDTVIEFHDRPSPHVMNTVLLLEFVNLLEYILKELTQVLRPLACFRCVLREIFKDGPEIQQSTPVDISEIHQEHVLLEIIKKCVVPLQPKIA